VVRVKLSALATEEAPKIRRAKLISRNFFMLDPPGIAGLRERIGEEKEPRQITDELQIVGTSLLNSQ
jgi:hypothetical protein